MITTVTVAWAVAFFLVLGAGIYAGRKFSGAMDWSVANKSLTAIGVGVVLGAWQIGGMSIIGVAQMGFNMGIAGSLYTITGGVYLILYAIIAGIIRSRMQEDSISAFYLNCYGSKVSKLYTYLYLVLGFFYIPIQLFALSTVLVIVIPGITTTHACLIGLVLCAGYVSISGMKGARIVGMCTGILAYATIAVGAVLAVNKAGGLTSLRSSLPKSFFTFSAMPTSQWLGWILTNLFGTTAMQAALQPLLAAKDSKSARRGAVLGTCIAVPIGLFTATIGMVAKVALPQTDSAQAFAAGVNHFLSPPLVGVIFATVTLIIATTLSTMLLSVGTVLRMVYRDFSPSATDGAQLKFSRVGTAVFALITIFPTLVIGRTTLTPLFMIVLAIALGPHSFPVFMGLFKKKVNQACAFWSIILSTVAGFAWWVFGNPALVHPIYPTVAVSWIAGLLVMRFGKQPVAA
jgi:Na+/proline symporter